MLILPSGILADKYNNVNSHFTLCQLPVYNVYMTEQEDLVHYLNRIIPHGKGNLMASALGITRSHLSAIRRGRSRPSPRLCKVMAFQFGLSEVDVLRMAGYLEPADAGGDQVEQLVLATSEQLPRDPDLQVIVKTYLETRSQATRRRLRDIVVAAAGAVENHV